LQSLNEAQKSGRARLQLSVSNCGILGLYQRHENFPDSKGQHFTPQEPFMTFEFDGVLGLGLASLAVDPEFSADPRA